MKTFTQPAITDYRQLSEADAAMMDRIKKHAEETRELVGEVQNYLGSLPLDEPPQPTFTDSHRWVSIASTQLQQGYMALVRSVAKPWSF